MGRQQQGVGDVGSIQSGAIIVQAPQLGAWRGSLRPQPPHCTAASTAQTCSCIRPCAVPSDSLQLTTSGHGGMPGAADTVREDTVREDAWQTGLLVACWAGMRIGKPKCCMIASAANSYCAAFAPIMRMLPVSGLRWGAVAGCSASSVGSAAVLVAARVIGVAGEGASAAAARAAA